MSIIAMELEGRKHVDGRHGLISCAFRRGRSITRYDSHVVLEVTLQSYMSTSKSQYAMHRLVIQKQLHNITESESFT
jgi:hypothetical protein